MVTDTMLVASESFHGTLDDGTEVHVVKGKDYVRDSNPIACKWPQFFKPATSRFAGLEDTTAEPGRKRGER